MAKYSLYFKGNLKSKFMKAEQVIRAVQLTIGLLIVAIIMWSLIGKN